MKQQPVSFSDQITAEQNQRIIFLIITIVPFLAAFSPMPVWAMVATFGAAAVAMGAIDRHMEALKDKRDTFILIGRNILWGYLSLSLLVEIVGFIWWGTKIVEVIIYASTGLLIAFVSLREFGIDSVKLLITIATLNSMSVKRPPNTTGKPRPYPLAMLNLIWDWGTRTVSTYYFGFALIVVAFMMWMNR